MILLLKIHKMAAILSQAFRRQISMSFKRSAVETAATAGEHSGEYKFRKTLLTRPDWWRLAK